VNGDPQAALALLAEAVDQGFATPGLLDQNDDFDAVRGLAGWADLTARARAQAGAQRAAASGSRVP
jgi:hypothetical protein